MQIFKTMKVNIFNISILALLLISVTSCQKEIKLEERVFQINKESLYATAADKTKEKNNSQWVAVLYTNLFQQALSAGDLYSAGQCITSIGDKELAREVIISNFMNYVLPVPIITSNVIMRSDIDAFIIETYERFLIRRPTEGEKAYFKSFIENDPNVTAELVYFSFALSKEYLFY
jgi:hypothetical protein